jgi:sugar/nucleoside kinase (ribokinase family)
MILNSKSIPTKPANITYKQRLTSSYHLAKSFKYTTPILEIQESELPGTALLNSKVFHYLASPQDMKARVLNMLALREQAGIQHRPLIIWEPAPLSCKPENLQDCLAVAALVDVFSPNHLELAALFEDTLGTPDRTEIERLALKFLANRVGPEGKGAVIIRAGENGCFVRSGNLISKWLPPFHIAEAGEEQATKVVDPTGAGNAFLGGYSIGYLQTGGDIIQAACYGSVAASFALEQVGMPEKRNEGDGELWNGASVLGRLHEYRARLLTTLTE